MSPSSLALCHLMQVGMLAPGLRKGISWAYPSLFRKAAPTPLLGSTEGLTLLAEVCASWSQGCESGRVHTAPFTCHVVTQERERVSSPHPLLPMAGKRAETAPHQLPIQESGPSTLPRQHIRIDPVDRGTDEIDARELEHERSAPLPFGLEAMRLGEFALPLTTCST